jgi:hypothetical protein
MSELPSNTAVALGSDYRAPKDENEMAAAIEELIEFEADFIPDWSNKKGNKLEIEVESGKYEITVRRIETFTPEDDVKLLAQTPEAIQRTPEPSPQPSEPTPPPSLH